MSALAVSPAYTALLVKFPPRIIRSEEQNESYTAALYELDQRNESWTAEEADLADLLTLLIEDFEEKQYNLPKSSPGEVLEFLLDQHGLGRIDMADVLGGPNIVSEVLSGARELTKDQIRRLSERFKVSPELFF